MLCVMNLMGMGCAGHLNYISKFTKSGVLRFFKIPKYQGLLKFVERHSARILETGNSVPVHRFSIRRSNIALVV